MLLRPDLGEATYRPGALHEVDGEDVVLTGQGQGDGLAAEFGQLLEQRTGHRMQVEVLTCGTGQLQDPYAKAVPTGGGQVLHQAGVGQCREQPRACASTGRVVRRLDLR